MEDSQVLIVGAGPTGLVLALFLAHSGVKPRVIEKNSGPGQTSRAMVVQARTLELYRQIGLGDAVVERGIKMKCAHVWKNGRVAGQISFADMGEGLSPYPFALSFPQDDHEKILGERLKAAGVEIEWNTELVAFTQTGGALAATLRKDGVEESCSAKYICGCDGAHSKVRETLQIDFPGGTYDQRFFVADVDCAGAAAMDDGFSFCLAPHELCLLFPIRSTGMHRLIGLVPDDLAGKDNLRFEDLQPYVERIVGVRVDKLNWFSSYRVHHRVGDQFRVGDAFILGDAGHIHSPAGGQGMNTGIGDAVNLAWKLAAVIQNRANALLLDTYEQERIAFARSLVATTDRLFQLMVGEGAGGEFMREALVPHLAPFLMGFSSVREAAFRMISQTKINYRHSDLSGGVAGDVHGGDRLPWVRLADGSDNFAQLTTLDWQIHVYGDIDQEIRDATWDLGLPTHKYEWTDAMADTGVKRDALYLVRPDGYVGLVQWQQDANGLREYLSKFEVLAVR